ncbi:alpha/beta fold hydrolase [Epilithonimonas arachidiradicis]|uniref:Carboxypeptidase-like protein n=1 Tax=Epilithonimonas arachidiradicis TaxID=1617282 RepID=A0A420CPV7_9FLAO|nr:alpha/beta fold hydrolase [Epilithonimonas arachidiradicis]RKE80453.1 carboxypeptidase-like protein [Epilithonimonas arachidiradicis]GGG63648.1 hypothetical protein GCM10007332_27310 [Epilithonimonas arachidiradicis]
MQKLLFLLILLIGFNLKAQKISGTVKNTDNEIIAYGSIGIKNSKNGAITNEKGNYQLELPQDSDSKITFSASGYQDKTVSSNELKLNPNIILDYKTTQIENVNIVAKQMKEKLVGQKSKPLLTFSKMFDKNIPTVEQGNIFPIYQKTKLKSYNFHIIPSSRYQEITLKLNIYKVKNDLPEQSLLDENIIYKTSTTGWQNIDLSNYRLMFNNLDKIAITLQLVDYKPMENFDFVFGISAKKTLSKDLLFRYQSQGNWETFDGSFISNIDISYDKTKNEKEIAEVENNTENDFKTNQLIAYYENKEKAKKTEFGKSRNGQFIDLNDAKIYYEEYGKGEPLLLLHGNNGSISDFYKQIPFFSKHYRVIAIDTRGQGRSTDLTTDDYSYDQFASDLYKIIKNLKLDKVNIVGWSDGGNTGLTFNLEHPELVNKLVTIGANLDPCGVDENLIKTFQQQLAENTGNPRLIKLMLNHPNINYKELMNIHNPVLVIAGSNDVIKPEHTNLINSFIKNSELAIIPNSTHYVPFEQPEKLNDIILNFLKK